MKPPSLVARHEAAHAVVAAHYDLTMCEVTIVPSVIEGREVAGCVRFADVPMDNVELIRAAAATLAGRVEIERRTEWAGEIPESSYQTDERVVRQIAERMNVPNERYEEWRAIVYEITSKVLNVACISDTVEMVAFELDKHMTITPEAVKSLLLFTRASYPKALQDVQEDIALVERAQQIWS